MQCAVATEGGTGKESGAPGRNARRSTRPSSRHEAAPAQCRERPPCVRTRTQEAGAAWFRASQVARREESLVIAANGSKRESCRVAPPCESFVARDQACSRRVT